VNDILTREKVRDSLAQVVRRRTLINTGLQAGASPLAMKMSRSNGLSFAGRIRKAVETAFVVIVLHPHRPEGRC